MAKLTGKQRRFVEEYLIDANGARAAIRAGYSAKTAQEQSSRLLSKVKAVQDAVAAGMAAKRQRSEITADTVLSEIATLAFSDIGQILDFTGDVPRLKPANQIPEAARRCISTIKVRRYMEGKGDDAREVEVVEFKLWDKGTKLQDLAKHLGLLMEKVEHTGTVAVQLIEQVVDEAGNVGAVDNKNDPSA